MPRQPHLTRMVLFLVAVAAVAGALLPALSPVFLANPALNGLILGVLAVGIVYIFRQVLLLQPERAWLDAFREGRPTRTRPQLLAPMERMLGERKGKFSLSALSTRSLLDSISSRLDESRELSRYLIGLLIFLGLLGTFWGLLRTVHSVAGVIGGLSMTQSDVSTLFANLQKGLQAPLEGMGTAFSASLFGLAGSLILGFLELQASQAQNRFFNDLEDWLAGATRLGSGAGLVESEQSIPAYVQALLENTAENLDALQRTVSQAEEGRRTANTNLMALAEKLGTLADQMRAEQGLLINLANSQMEMKPILARLAEAQAGGGMDEATRQHIRNMDVYLARLVEDQAQGRTQAVQELRSEIKLLARTIAALADEQRA